MMRFRPQEILRKKRDGQELDDEELRDFVQGIADGDVDPAQTGAFTMATYLQGMTTTEIVSLVLAMRDSGVVADWEAAGIDRSKVIEKHSSGGVGDEKITLLVVPVAVACGLYVPNMSAWGLDYCPGEVDMLDSVPGYDGVPGVDTFVKNVVETGGSIIGPNPDLAPADSVIFQVRDVTATVESVPLITGSIMSKKLAANPSGVVISVGCGSGAFMHTIERARELATSMHRVATGAGIPSVMLITDLNSVLGSSVGSAVEMIEVANFLTGAYRDRRVTELVLTISAHMLVLGGIVADMAAGLRMAREHLESGAAAAKFDEILHAQGGPEGFTAHAREILPEAAVVRPVHCTSSGWISSMDTTEIGKTLVDIGGGRVVPGGEIDLTVGFTEFAQIGDAVDPHSAALCVLHCHSEESWQAAARRLREAVEVVDKPVAAAGPIIREHIGITTTNAEA